MRATPTSQTDEAFMARALALAAQGGRAAHPNPYVGALVVHRGRILGEGWHARFGGKHAEVVALEAASKAGLTPEAPATLYVTLEPCAHIGKTPPCVDAILQSPIKRVVIATPDTHPKVSGRGIERLKESGLEVRLGVCQKEAEWLNRRFITYTRKGRPYVVLKWAESKEGLLGLAHTGTPLMSHAHTQCIHHTWRSHEDALLVGKRTALWDNPQLTVRHSVGKNPKRVVLAPKGDLPPQLKLMANEDGLTHVYAYEEALRGRAKGLYRGIPRRHFLEGVLRDMHSEGVLSVMVEGGRRTLDGFIEDGLWDEARRIQTPYVLGHDKAGIAAPVLPKKEARLVESHDLHPDHLSVYVRTP